MSEQTTKIDDGGPAFAAINDRSDGSEGMSLRDYLAAKAMARLIEDHRMPEYLSDFGGSESTHDRWVAARAYEIADAMLKARGNPK